MIHHARGPKSFADAVSRVPVRCSELCLCLSLTLGCDISGSQSLFLEQKLPRPVIPSVRDAAVRRSRSWAQIPVSGSGIRVGKWATESFRACCVVFVSEINL